MLFFSTFLIFFYYIKKSLQKRLFSLLFYKISKISQMGRFSLYPKVLTKVKNLEMERNIKVVL